MPFIGEIKYNGASVVAPIKITTPTQYWDYDAVDMDTPVFINNPILLTTEGFEEVKSWEVIQGDLFAEEGDITSSFPYTARQVGMDKLEIDIPQDTMCEGFITVYAKGQDTNGNWGRDNCLIHYQNLPEPAEEGHTFKVTSEDLLGWYKNLVRGRVTFNVETTYPDSYTFKTIHTKQGSSFKDDPQEEIYEGKDIVITFNSELPHTVNHTVDVYAYDGTNQVNVQSLVLHELPEGVDPIRYRGGLYE